MLDSLTWCSPARSLRLALIWDKSEEFVALQPHPLAETNWTLYPWIHWSHRCVEAQGTSCDNQEPCLGMVHRRAWSLSPLLLGSWAWGSDASRVCEPLACVCVFEHFTPMLALESYLCSTDI